MADINIFETRRMLDQLEIIRKPSMFLTKTFFQKEDVSDTENIDIDIRKKARRVAAYVNRDAKGNIVEREGYTTYTYKPPYLSEIMVTTAGDLLKRQPGQVLYATNMSPEQKSSKILADDLDTLNSMIERAEEIQASKALFDAAIPILDKNGETVSETVTFPREASHTVDLTLTGSVPWSNTAADIPENFREYRRMIVTNGNVSADMVIMAYDVVPNFLNNTLVKAYLDKQVYNLAQVEMIEKEMHVKYVGRLEGLPIWEYDETYIDPATGLESYFVPEGKVLFASTQAECYRAYGAIYDMDENGAGVAAVARFPKTWTEPNPARRFLQVQSAPLLIPARVDAFVSVKVQS